MTANKAETAIGLCVVALTKFLMQKYTISEEEAYKKFMEMDLYDLLMDRDTRLYLETNMYLIQCCEKECDEGKDTLYHFINED